MKRLIILFILLLTGCSTAQQSVMCQVVYDDEAGKVERSLLITHKDNEVVSVKSEDKIYFDDALTQEMAEKLQGELVEKYKNESNITYNTEVMSDYLKISAKLSNFAKASDLELSMIGLSVTDKTLPVGLSETLLLNQINGYSCEDLD